MKASKLRVGVFGAGVIGAYLGTCLASSGCDVTLLVRREGALDGASLSAYPTPRRRRVPRGPVLVTVDPRSLRSVDVCLVTVKARDVAAAGAILAEVLPATTPVVSLQNGLRSAEVLAERLGGERVAAGVVACNVVRGDGGYRRATRGDVHVERLGPPHERVLAALARAFEPSGQRLELHADLGAIRAGKLLLNLNNGVAAATGLSIRDTLASPEARRLFAQCIDEGLAAAAAAGVRPARLGPVPPRLLPYVLRLPARWFDPLAGRMAGVDPRARSSTLVDLVAGKPTEIDELNGAVLELAERFGLEAPANALVVRTVHALETRSRAGALPLSFPTAAALLDELHRRT